MTEEFMKVCAVLLIVISIISIAVLCHPWINQQTVNDYIDEAYPHINIRATLTDWHPYGYHFIVEKRILNQWTKVGSGFVNIFCKVTDLEIDFDSSIQFLHYVKEVNLDDIGTIYVFNGTNELWRKITCYKTGVNAHLF